MRVEWLDTIGELRQGGWDLLTSDGDLFRCCDWLDITASSDPGLVEAPRYLMVSDHAGPLAGSPVYILPRDTIPDPLVRVDLVHREALARSQPPRDWAAALLPGMLCGGWVPFDSRVMLARRDGGVQAMSPALDALLEYGDERGVSSFTFMYVADESHQLREELAGRGFATLPGPPRAVMEITWPDFNGYLASLRAGRRRTVKEDERMLAEAGVTFEIGTFAAPDVPAFARLATATANRYEPEASVAEMARWLATMQQQTHMPTAIIKASLNGKLCAFLLLVEWRGVLYPQHCGIDYELKGKLPVYFGILYYHTIRYALDRGIHRIEYNIGSADVKRSRGCALTPQWTMVRAADQEVRDALCQACGA
jgi:uncharacterized protein